MTMVMPVLASAGFLARNGFGRLRHGFWRCRGLPSFQPETPPALGTSIGNGSEQKRCHIVESVPVRSVNARTRAVFTNVGHTLEKVRKAIRL
jgi:hypothetical protein